ncbi:hypothetical protein CI089_07965 [Microbacterium sp. Yaish 1]|nr:hypothetical protein CI089_07965 [Microbacterium sp. Yaish 1]
MHEEEVVSHRKKLEATLSEAFRLDNVDDQGFLLSRPGGPPVQVMASEEDVAAMARMMAADALLALGEIDDDPSGGMAAVGLLGIHVEELIASQPTVAVVRVTPTGLKTGDGPTNRTAQ